MKMYLPAQANGCVGGMWKVHQARLLLHLELPQGSPQPCGATSKANEMLQSAAGTPSLLHLNQRTPPPAALFSQLRCTFVLDVLPWYLRLIVGHLTDYNVCISRGALWSR